jgi:Ca2+-binding EF-hand superfamily protein
MKRKALVAIGLSTIFINATITMAQPPGPQAGSMMRMLPVMSALDADKDGEISAEEIDNAAKALKAIDKNNDGKLTMEEIRPNMDGMIPGARRPEGGGFGFGGAPANQEPSSMTTAEKVDKLMELDKNGDGQLSKDEVPSGLQRMLGKADSDNDGQLTREDLEKVAETLPINFLQGTNAGDGAGSDSERGRMREGAGRAMFADGPTAMIDRLFRLDADKDGKLTRDELGKLKDFFGDRTGQRPGQRSGRPGEKDTPKK